MNLVLFFSYNVSLKTWEDSGILDREILLYERLTTYGVKVTFITYGDEEDYAIGKKFSKIKILPVYTIIGKPKCKSFRMVQSFFIPLYLGETLKNADILKTNQMYGAWIAVIAKILYKKKIVLRCGYEWYRNTFVRQTYKDKRFLLYKLIGFVLSYFSYRLADKIIISNNSDIDFVKRRFSVENRKIYRIGNFIDTNLFKWYKPGAFDRVLFIGRLTAQKNIINICRAIKILGIGLDVVGEGEQKKELVEIVEREAIDVRFLGLFSNKKLPEVINNYSVFVLTSFYENNPKVLLEAMACGRAVIGANVEGINEVIKHGVNGLLSDNSEDSICDAIKRLRADEQLCSRLGKAAREYVTVNYSIDKIVKAEYQIYSDLLTE